MFKLQIKISTLLSLNSKRPFSAVVIVVDTCIQYVYFTTQQQTWVMTAPEGNKNTKVQ